MEFVDLEGGFWTIVCSDTRRLVVTNLSQEFLVDGLKVELEGEEEASFGISMMGNTFNVAKARRL